MILLFLLGLLGDDNTLYLMDKSFSFIPIEEEFRFTYSENGIQTTYGSRDSENLHEMYRVKIWVPLFSKIIFQYNLEKEEDYDIKKEEHLFKLGWIPEDHKGIPLSFSLFLSPESEKNNSYLGLGFGYWKNIKNNHTLNLSLHEFEDSFTDSPISIVLKGCLNNNQADLHYKYYKTIKSEKKFLENNEEIRHGEFNAMGLKNTIYYRILPRISPGLRLNYTKNDSSYVSIPEDSLLYSSNTENFFTELFIKTKISEKNTIHIGLPMNWRYIRNDSLEYKRKWLGLTLLYKHALCDCLNLTLGIQKSWRNLNEEKNNETRAVLGFDLDLNKKTYFIFRQGVEMDFPLPDNLKDYNNHTYFMLNYCF
jgi:hypothetical protein